MSAGTEALYTGVADVPAPAQAAIELDLAKDAFDDALLRWFDFTPREFGDIAERWWHARNVLRESIAGES